MDESQFADLTLSKWVTVQAWFRIKLPDLCKDLDKVLYLDCDTLIRGNLDELFSLDLTDKYLAGVKDVWGVSKYVKRLGMKSGVYVNSGMLLFNCNYFLYFVTISSNLRLPPNKSKALPTVKFTLF